MYSFSINYDQTTCVTEFDCQSRLMQVRGSTAVVLFNIFTIGTVEVGDGDGSVTYHKLGARVIATKTVILQGRPDLAERHAEVSRPR